MNPSNFPGFESVSGFEDLFNDEGLGFFDDSANPQQTQTQAQEQQQPGIDMHNHELPIDGQFQSLSQSSPNEQDNIADPVQLQLQPQLPPQAPLQEINPHYEQPTCQSDLQHLIRRVKTRIDVLQSQVEAEEVQEQLEHTDQQLHQELHAELQPGQPSVQRHQRPLEAIPADQNPPKRRRVAEESTGNSSWSNFLLSLDSSPSERGIKCPSCDKKFADASSVRCHFQIVHARSDTKSNICPECLVQFCSEDSFRGHWKRAHVGLLDFECNLCEARFSKKRNLSMHRTKVHKLRCRPEPKTKRLKKPKLPKCNLCGFEAPEKHNITMHFFAEHCDEIGLECPTGCGETFESKEDTSVHYFNCTHESLVDQ